PGIMVRNCNAAKKELMKVSLLRRQTKRLPSREKVSLRLRSNPSRDKRRCLRPDACSNRAEGRDGVRQAEVGALFRRINARRREHLEYAAKPGAREEPRRRKYSHPIQCADEML